MNYARKDFQREFRPTATEEYANQPVSTSGQNLALSWLWCATAVVFFIGGAVFGMML
jgi:hypothetical protein